MARYKYRPFARRPAPELAGGQVARPKVVVVGAGPVGLAAAIDLALHGIGVVLLDDNDVVSIGSRAICWSKRTLEIFDRLGVAERMLALGVTWKVGRIFHGERELYQFDLLPEAGHKMPAFINLQQYYVEQFLVERCADFPERIDLRWKNNVVGIEPREDGVSVAVATPEGDYRLETDWLIACDGARSSVRDMLGLDFIGQMFEERFLIADVEMRAPFPAERWFWFDPPFHPGQSALLHKQPDDIWRIDLQLGPDADPEAERAPERVTPRIQKMVGARPFELDWVSIYSFHCRRLARFIHGRVIFAGDAAHVVSPFGARGGNGGIQDIDNLAWKLAAVIRGEAGPQLLASYDEERQRAADENILNAARSTHFMTPRNAMEQSLRTEILRLAEGEPFARPFVNAGRLSRPCSLAGLSLQTPPADAPGGGAPGPVYPGEVCPDAPIADAAGRRSMLLERLGGDFKLLAIGEIAAPAIPGLAMVRVGPGGFVDVEGLVAARYGNDVLYLVRPDQHVAARFTTPDAAPVAAALARARGGGEANAGGAAMAGEANTLAARADDIVAALIEASGTLSRDEQFALLTRLVLLLAERVGEADAVIEAIAQARASAAAEEGDAREDGG